MALDFSFSDVKNYFNDKKEDVEEFFTSTSNSIKDSIKEKEAEFVDFKEKIKNNATELFDNTTEKLEQTMDDLSKTTSKAFSELSEKLEENVNNLLEKTGATISNVKTQVSEIVEGWKEDPVGSLKKTFASVVNTSIAYGKGLVKLGEAGVDLLAILKSVEFTMPMVVLDVVKGIATGDWDWPATKKLWNTTKSFVSYDITNNLIFDKFYDTKVGKWLDKNAYDPFKSDGTICKISEGVGYVAGIIAISVLTFGAGGVAFGASATVGGVTINAGTVAITAAAAGIGKYTEEEWNQNCLSISYGEQEIGLTIDYQKYKEIEELKNGQSITIMQQMTGEDGKPFNMTFTITKNGDTYSIKDSNGNQVGFNGIKESSTIKGLGKAALRGAGDGLKAYTTVSTLGNLQSFVSAASQIGGGNFFEGAFSIIKEYGAKQSTKKLVNSSLKNTFKDVGFYIDSLTHVYTDVKKGIEKGDWNLLETGAKIIGAYGVNFLGNLGGNISDGIMSTSSSGLIATGSMDDDLNIIARPETVEVSSTVAIDDIVPTNQIDDMVEDVATKKNIIANGGSYDNLDEVCQKHGITREDYLNLTRTKQHHMTDDQRKLVFDIRKDLTLDVTDSAGVVLPGTKVSKSIDADTFAQYYKDGDAATLGGCIALERDTSVFGGNATEIIDSTGLRFDGSKFVDGAGKPNEFYIVEGVLSDGQPDVSIRISATTDATQISDTVLEQFRKKYPDYKYKGYDIADVSSSNNTYLNEIWTKNSESQVKMLASTSGVSEKNIVTEQARWYNRPNNPDMGNGTTLNQGNSNSLGLPEFFAKERVGLSDGEIYSISNGSKIKVADIIGGIVYRI